MHGVTSKVAAHPSSNAPGHGSLFKSKHSLPKGTAHSHADKNVHSGNEKDTDRSRPPSVFSLTNKSPTESKRPQTPIHDERAESKPAPDSARAEEHGTGQKDKKKGVSFLSRFIPTKKKETPVERDHEDESETSDMRPEGIDALPFSHNAHNIEYNPNRPQPPAYIKIRSKHKKVRDFDRVFLSQELRPPEPSSTRDNVKESVKQATTSDPHAIWALDWSKSGQFLAAGGQDKVVRIWAVLSTQEERRRFEEDQDASVGGQRLQAPVFSETPHREFRGHEGAIADLNWSKNEFLLSSSLDRTVRLWHPSMTDCLCTFKHADVVLSVRFHPRDDRFFLAGSRDSKLRLWSIPDKSVAYWTHMPDVVTAVGFVPDGKMCMAGTINGVCSFFETEGLKDAGQIIAKSTHGKNARGSKINSIESFTVGADGHDEQHKDSTSNEPEARVLISSADSRLRLYNIRNRALEFKCKGHKAEELPIKATISDCGAFIVSGSEDRGAYIWTTGPGEAVDKPGQRPVESFEASRDKTTAVLMAPTKTRAMLVKSGDPIYDLCNPPPVTLMSRAESVSSKPATEPADGSLRASPPKHRDALQSAPSLPQQPTRETAAQRLRNEHHGGHIIVTASTAGKIRVYRQDCGYSKRRSSGAVDNGSVFADGRRSSQVARLMMGRDGSQRNIFATRSGSYTSKVNRSDSNTTQPPQDRILSWRQGIQSTASFERHRAAGGSVSRTNSDVGSHAFANGATGRSNSPRKSMGSYSVQSTNYTADPDATQRSNSQALTESPGSAEKERPEPQTPVQPHHPSISSTDKTPTSTSSASNFQTYSGYDSSQVSPQALPQPTLEVTTPTGLDTEQIDPMDTTSAETPNPNSLMLSGGKSYMFWDPRAYVSDKFFKDKSNRLAPVVSRASVVSAVSMLSSEEEDAEEKKKDSSESSARNGRR